MNRKNIAMRDPALAALVGATPADFGHEDDDFGAEFAGVDYLDDVADALDESGFGAEFGAPTLQDMMSMIASSAPGAPAVNIGHGNPYAAMAAHPAAAAQIMAQGGAGSALLANHLAGRARTRSRESLLEPNKGSATKVERYTFSVSDDVVAGTPKTISVSNQPDTTIRPQRVTCNAPTPGFFIIDSIRVANVNVTVGGVIDAYDFNSNGVGQSLDMPTLSPSNKLSVSGGYTGLIPSFLLVGNPYKLIVSVKGPASIVA